ncbi:unnamed protein product [Brassicogethes aeneus]|uniref:Coiled-coil domain-containing protein 134 n=1 Tax=Brassicogethes aeneus TaxID=1431903 RepID=A0A9P0BE24_BRAAE|nr:unnamed protein product [Brassicogethes aeneus]
MIKMLFLPILVVLCITFVTNGQTDSELAEKLYIRLLKHQRAEQLDAIKSFSKISSYEKQYSMITLMAEKVFTAIQASRAHIESSPYIPGVSDFPLDNNVRIALSNILENTVLFCEMILRFPDIATSVMKINNNWDVLLQWSIAFSNQVKYLLDPPTVKLLTLVSMELNHIERDVNYVNPYRKKTSKIDSVKNAKKTKKKKTIKKGPRLTHFEL